MCVYWVEHIEYFSVCRWTVIVSLKRKALETPLKMKSLLDRCSFIQFIEYIGIGYLFCVRFPCDDFLYRTRAHAHYAHTMAYAMLTVYVSRILLNVKQKPRFCTPHTDSFILFRWRVEKQNFFLSTILCFSQFIKTYTMLLKMYCWPILCETQSYREKKSVYLSEIPNKWKSIEWQKLFASDIVFFFGKEWENETRNR